MGTARPTPDRRANRCRTVMRERPEAAFDGTVRRWPVGELTDVPATPRWTFAVVAVATTTGRISLPACARHVLGVGPSSVVRASARGDHLLLQPDGPGRPVTVDGCGRLTLPAWLRRAAGATGSAVIAASSERPVVVVVPTSALDAVADAWVGER